MLIKVKKDKVFNVENRDKVGVFIVIIPLRIPCKILTYQKKLKNQHEF